MLNGRLSLLVVRLVTRGRQVDSFSSSSFSFHPTDRYVWYLLSDFPSGRDKLTETGDGARVSNCPFSSLLYPPKLCPNDRQKFPSSRDRPANTLSLLLTHHYYYSYYCAWPPTVLLPIRPVIECPSDANSCPADVQFVTIGLVRSNNKEYLFCGLLPGRIVRRN